MLRICGATEERTPVVARRCWCGRLFCGKGGYRETITFRRECRVDRERLPLRSRAELDAIVSQADLFDGSATRDKWRDRLARTKRAAAALVALALLAATPAYAQLAIVQKYRAEYPTPLGAENTVRLLASVAADVNGGLLRKTSGNNCLGYSCDVICFADGRAVDVLADSEGAATPVWSPIAPLDPALCDLAPAIPPPDGPIDPPPVDPVATATWRAGVPFTLSVDYAADAALSWIELHQDGVQVQHVNADTHGGVAAFAFPQGIAAGVYRFTVKACAEWSNPALVLCSPPTEPLDLTIAAATAPATPSAIRLSGVTTAASARLLPNAARTWRASGWAPGAHAAPRACSFASKGGPRFC